MKTHRAEIFQRLETCAPGISNRWRFPFALLASLCVPLTPVPALTVRVDPAGGAPRIVVDGRPVRARMFWGSPGASNIRLSQEAQRIEYEFTAAEGADNGTMHFRFGRKPGEIFLDDVRVTDLSSSSSNALLHSDFENGQESFARDWTFWPVHAANTVGSMAVVTNAGRDGSGALRVTLKAPAGGEWPDFHIYHQPRLKIVAGHRYRVSFWIRADGSRALTTAFYKPGQPFTFLGGPADSFVSEIKLAAGAEVDFVSFPIPMPWPGPEEKTDWSGVDAACRRVLDANPAALLVPRIPMDPPPWWREAHPDEVMQWEDGRRDKAVPASPVYRRDAAERLTALVTHLEEKFGDHVAGYHPNGQNTGEWFYESSWEKPLSGFAPADLAGWRAWLRRKYGSDDALRAAWGATNAALEAVAVPAVAERRSAPAGVLRDPVKERALIDWAGYQNEAMADCVIAFARAAREASKGRKLVLFFYGYVFELAGLHNGPAVSGHFALRRVLDCPDLDVLCAPISYFDRGLGGGAPAMTAAESVALAGKLWLNEDDTHTFLATEEPPGWKDHVNTIEETNHELVRNVAQEALRNFGTWWMDLCASGWFNDERMWAEMARLKPLDEAMLQHPTPYRPEIAAVVDERAMLRVSANAHHLTWPGVYESRRALGRCGAPFGQYLLDDVLAGRVQAKLYVFLNPWDVTPEQRAKLLALTRGASRIWCVPPGTGPAAAKPVLREADGDSLFHDKPALTSDFVRGAARGAGVHLFAQTDCNVYANGPFLALHASQDGTVEIDTGKDGEILDLMTGGAVGRGPKIPLVLKRGDTRIFKY